MTLRDETGRALLDLTRARQRDGRIPGVMAGVARGGALAWHTGVGSADLAEPGTPPDADQQFLIASNTKTFTAVMIMALRDEGRLDLHDTLDTIVPEVTHRGLTIRQCLAHASGMQREPLGDVWETLQTPDTPALLRDFSRAERVHRPHHLFHYSNLVYSILGEVVARLDARSWAESLQTRILDPLEMRRTTVGFSGRHVQGYYVPAYTDVPVAQDGFDLRALGPAAALASTAGDLAKWSAFVDSPATEILRPDTLEEMCEPQVVIDRERWSAAMGLGFMLFRSGTRTYVGHTGGMPGHITAVVTDREAHTGGIALTSSGTSPDIAGFAVALADLATDREPIDPGPWTPGTTVPDSLRELLGVWFTEGAAFEFSVRHGRLEARAQGAPAHKTPSRFEEVEPDLFRTVAGREHGEALRVTRRSDGTVLKLNWATYLLSREALAFGQHPL